MATYKSNLTTDGAIKLVLEITELSQSQATNTSQVRFRALIQGSAGGTTYNYDPTPGYLIANGARFDFSLPSYSWAGTINTVLIDKTITVHHDNSGNATASGTVYWDPQNPSSVLGLIPATTNGNMALTRIGRADVVWNGTYTVGDQGFVIKVPTKYGLATRYVVRLSVGGTQFDYELPNVNQSEYLVIPTQDQLNAFYRSAGSTVSQVSYYATLYTYQGSTLIGYTTDQATIIFSADTNIPTLDNLSIGVNVKETNAAVLNVVGHTFLSLISKIKIDITNAISQYGANIVSYEILVKNSSGTTVGSSTTSSLIFSPANSGQFMLYARVKDSRGTWSTYRTLAINVLTYSLPSIRTLVANRVNSDGTLNVLGTNLKVEMSGAVASILLNGLQKNRLTYKLDDITSGIVNKVPSTNIIALNFTDTKIISTFAIDQVYKIQLTVTDAFGKSASSVFIIPISQVPMTWGKKGIAAGGIFNEFDDLGIAFQVYDTAHFTKKVTFDVAPDFKDPLLQKNLKSGDNLDNFTETGFYNAANASGILKTPTQKPFGMVSIKSGYNAIQILSETGINPRSWIRSSDGGDWQEILSIVEKNGDYKNGYIRYSDGKQVTWKHINISSQTFPNSVGTNYYSDAVSLGSQPASFADNNINVSTYVEANGVFTSATFLNINQYDMGNVYLTRNGTNSPTGIIIKVRCEGRWR